jgi:hypothetical protein
MVAKESDLDGAHMSLTSIRGTLLPWSLTDWIKMNPLLIYILGIKATPVKSIENKTITMKLKVWCRLILLGRVLSISKNCRLTSGQRIIKSIWSSLWMTIKSVAWENTIPKIEFTFKSKWMKLTTIKTAETLLLSKNSLNWQPTSQWKT